MGISQLLRWDVLAMVVSLCIVFGLEMLGVFMPGRFVTITLLVRTYMPKWAQVMVWAWLGWHFKVFGD